MILIINREMMFPNREQYIGNTGDSNSEIRTFRINRLLPGGVDIAHLNFKLDLQYCNGEKDACDLKKEVSDEYIILHWEIVSEILQVPGPIFANVRAYDDVGEVRWSSYKGVFYAEESIDTPGEYEKNLTELEEIELKLTFLEESAKASKEAAETAKEDAEEAAAEAKKAKEDMNSIGIATTKEVGIVKPDGETVNVGEDGGISVPKATTEKYGIVKPDNETVGFSDDGLLKVLMSGLKVTDVQGAVGEENAEVVLQNFINVIADKVVNQMLTKGMLVNDGTTEEAGKYPLDAAYGKTLLELCKEAKEKATPADWTINDENTAGYVKGRTHWKEKVSDAIEVLPETTLEFKTTINTLSTLGTDNITLGTLYNVYWNGTLYECTAYNLVGDICLGNPKVVSYDEDTGEPFHIDLLTATSCIVTKETKDAESITLKIEQAEVVEYHPLDARYLPDGAGGGVTSWNDLTDKPFYEEIIEIFPETTVTLDTPDGTCYYTQLDTVIDLKVSETYIVNWNGVEYERVCIVANNYIYLGNDNQVGGENTGEPFFIYKLNGATTIQSLEDLLQEVALSITQKNIHYLDPKYIKDMYYTETGGIVEILPETTVASDEDMAAIPAITLVEGETYTVTWNGVEYKTICQLTATDGQLVYFMGDFYTYSDGAYGTEATGEPFLITAFTPEGAALAGINVMVASLTGESPVTFSITGSGGETIHPIPAKYIPDPETIDITINEDGETGTAPISFAIAYAMSSAKLQSSIRLIHSGVFTYEYAVTRVLKHDVLSKTIVFYISKYDDSGLSNYDFEIWVWNEQHIKKLQTIGSIPSAREYEDGMLVQLDYNAANGLGWAAKFPTELIMASSTEDSTKKFKITVNDTGTITATEVTE